MDYTTIPLTRGLQTTISPDDADLAQHRWCAQSTGYAVRYSYDHAILMHRVIIERIIQRPLLPGEEVDHIDGDPLNNSRGNLRVATHAQNMRNRKRHTTNRSGYTGICFYTRKQKWRVAIRIDNKTHHLGYFATLAEAIVARDTAAQQYFGEWRRSP